MTEPKSIPLTAALDLRAATDGADGATKLHRFSMLAYTGAAVRIMGCGAITASASRFRSRRAESGARARRDRVRRWTCRG